MSSTDSAEGRNFTFRTFFAKLVLNFGRNLGAASSIVGSGMDWNSALWSKRRRFIISSLVCDPSEVNKKRFPAASSTSIPCMCAVATSRTSTTPNAP